MAGAWGDEGLSCRKICKLQFGGAIIVALQIEIGELQVGGRHVLRVKRAGFLQQGFRLFRVMQLEVRGAEEEISRRRFRRALQALIQSIDRRAKLALLIEHMAEIDISFSIVGIDLHRLQESASFARA